jgi:virginiamycin B lyase
MHHARIRRLSVLLVLLGVLLVGCMGDDSANGTATSDSTVTHGVTATPEPPQPAATPAPTLASTATATPTPSSATASTPTVAATATAAPTPTPTVVPLLDIALEDLADQLLAGGYVLYLRPMEARHADAATALEHVADCTTRKVLTASGEAQARELGVAWRQLALPLGTVLASEDCQALESARIVVVEYGTATELAEPLSADTRGVGLLREIPQAGSNTLLIGHQLSAENALGIHLTAPGEIAVFHPDGERSELVAVIPADAWLPLATARNGPRFQQYPVPGGTRPHDVAPATDGGIWYTAQFSGELGWLDPVTGESMLIPLGAGSAPHGVIVGPDGAAWITDGGLNAIVRVDAETHEVRVFPLPAGSAHANLNTAAFDNNGQLWFTGQAGVYGSVDPTSGEVRVWDAPRGRGPYGIDATPDGDIYYASLAGSHIARIDTTTAEAAVIEPPTTGQGARRVWSDSSGRIWVSEWNSGQVSVFDPASEAWREWRLPGDGPQTYAVYVDERDIVWLSDFGANALVRFDPVSEIFESFPLPASPSNVRQILGRPHEVWGAESAADTLVVLRVP